MVIKAKKINFNSPEDMEYCVHDVISHWLYELDNETDVVKSHLLMQKVIELEQVINRTGKPSIHFKNGKKGYHKIEIK